MAADDRTSQDAAVIGDDLVEALGFEPINSDLSEVAVLDDFDGADHDDVVETVVDDIEILDDQPAAEALMAPDTVEDELVEEDELVHQVDSEEAAVREPEAAPETEAIEPVAEDEGSLFGTPAPWPDLSTGDTDAAIAESDSAESDSADSELVEADSAEADGAEADGADIDGAPPTEKEASEAELDAGDAPVNESVDESGVDDSAATEIDEAVEPVVFFNNGIDTDTAPLSDIDLDGSSVADDLAVEKPELDQPAPADQVEDDVEGGATTSHADSIGDELIDLDDEASEGESDLDPAADTDLVAGLDSAAAVDPVADIDLSESDVARGEGADAAPADVDLTIEGEAVSLLEEPVGVPGPPAVDDLVEPPSILVDEPSLERGDSDRTEIVAPQPESEIVARSRRPKTRKKLRARKSRRVIRHIDPWSVLTFSVLFHLCFFAALLLASVLVWNAALAAGTIENIESFIRELGDYETFEINSDQVFRAAALIAGLLTLASSVLVVLLTVVFNLISDLIGGIRVTVIEEETVRIPTTARTPTTTEK